MLMSLSILVLCFCVDNCFNFFNMFLEVYLKHFCTLQITCKYALCGGNRASKNPEGTLYVIPFTGVSPYLIGMLHVKLL